LNVSIIGANGDLANAVYSNLQQDHLVTCYSKEQYDFRNKDDIVELSGKIHTDDVIISCVGIVDEDSWDVFTVNTLAPVYLLEQLSKHNSKSHVIFVGSHGAMWTSWPGISINRLVYNTSKQSLQSFVTGLDQSGTTELTVSILNPTKFQSKMSANHGYDINIVVESINHIINSPVLVYEYRNYKDVDR
jgi:short-subunit dehydrogenase